MQAKVLRFGLAAALVFACVLGVRADSMEVYKEPPRDPATGKYQFTEVLQVEGVPAAELYSRAKAWGAVAYRSMKDVEQLDDKDAGRLILKGMFTARLGSNSAWGFGTDVDVNHTLTIEVKDGRYRYLLTDFSISGNALEIQTKTKSVRRFIERTTVIAEGMVADLKASMSKPAEEW